MISKIDVINSSPITLGQEVDKGFEFNSCQKYICRSLFKGIAGTNGRFVVSVPPQHGKSTVCSLWLPVWYLNRYPKRNIIITSYNHQNAVKWGRRIRNIITQNSHLLSVKIARDASAAGFWETTAGGGVLCAGVGGTITGNPGHLIIIDDPIKDWETAQSQTLREKIIDWYKTTLSTRFQGDTTVLIVATRWHENDLSGFCLSGGTGEGWTDLRIPALAEDKDPMGRAPGVALWPQKFPVSKLEQKKKGMGAMMFAAMYQQSPQAQTGNVFLRDYWQRITRANMPRKFDTVIHSWDTALETKKTSAFTAVTRWGIRDGRYYLLGMWRAKADYPTVREKMLSLYIEDRADTVLLEDKASGKPLRQELEANTTMPIMAVNPVADKLARAWSVIPHFDCGRVWIVSGEEWADELIAGLAAFPNGNWTDVADTVSQALAWMGAIKYPGIKDLQAQIDYMEERGNSRFRRAVLPKKNVFRFGSGDYYE